MRMQVIFMMKYEVLLDAIIHPYQTSDSLIIYHPVLLLSKPLDILVQKSTNMNQNGNYFKSFNSFLNSYIYI